MEQEEAVDVEEGEISDTASVEEISEEDFHKQDEITSSVSTSNKSVDSNSNNSNGNSINSVITNGNNSNSINCNGEIKGNNNPKVWTMRDLYKFQVSRNYAPGLYNLAWAQAVQNKPLGEVLDMEYQNAGGDKLGNVDGKEAERVVIDVDDDVKEEGELEEGEIDLDSDVSMEICSDSGVVDGKSVVESRVELIRKGFESVTFDDAGKSFEQVCSKFQNLLSSLQEIVLEDSLSEIDSLIQLSFTAIQTINSVFCSMNHDQKEQNRDFLLRSLNLVTSQKSLPFSSKQLEEVNVMISSLDLSPVSSNNVDNDVNKSSDEVGVVTKIEFLVPEKSNQGLDSSKMFDVDEIPVKFSDKGQPVSPGYLPSVASNSRQRGVSLPLLDLHKDHDIDSLPSPTRQAPPPLPLHKAFDFGHGLLNPEWPVPKAALSMAKPPVHPYETDALKAVSSYQQKFGQASFFASDDLPSPTPSNDGNISDDDTSGEVASAPSDRNAHPVPALKIQQPLVSTVPNLGMFPGQESTNTWRSGPMTYGPVPAVKSSTGKRSKDPRLRLASDETTLVGYQEPIIPSVNMAPKVSPSVEIVNSRKQKIDEEPNLDGPVVKRQRSEIIIPPASKGLLALSGSGGRLQDNGLQIRESNQNLGSSGIGSRQVEHAATSIGTFSNSVSMTANQSHNLPMSSHSATTSLQSLLKDIAVNPSLLMNLVRMEQQKSAYPLKSSTQLPTSGSMIGSIPVMTMAPPKPSVPGPKDVGLLQIPTSGSIHGEIPVMTMPPPRPAVPGPKDVGLLQVPSQTVQLDDSTKVRMKPRDPRRVLHGVSSQKRGSIASDQTNITSSVLRQEGQTGPGSSPHSTPPDIGQQLMKNLKNIGDIMSVSQATTSQAVVSPTHSTLAKAQSSIRLASEDVVVPSRPQHSWSAVEHLFDGYDDKQKAAIQKERTRRMEEQRKMFSSKKLCLVLDLDHTLLNSAKFGEVDPLHEEILRKKEEQDREKPQRHLFRSSHMSMWTKLRPGIWNFLEKASKLFELHVYTMGNKVYATEMARLLDPKGELFAGRVMSRGDDGDLSDGDERTAKSKDLEGVLGMESSVVIIDDSVRVWPHNKLNLIVVERYIYFPCSRRQFGLHGPSLLEIDHDERPEDGTLASSLAVIERIHRNFFTNQSLEEVDVRNILAAEQRRILAGCRIVFSRVFPVGEANPQLHPLWQTAEQFGAVCTTQIDEQVTHVVANSFGTDKVSYTNL